MHKWKPISTAPHGKRILVYCGDDISFVAAFEQLSNRQAVYGWVNTYMPDKCLLATGPTHWHPLPESPKPAAVKKPKAKPRKH